MKTILLLFVLIHLTVAVCSGQNDFATVQADANACELNSAYFDMLRNELANDLTTKVSAKFYAGKSENIVISERRANYVRKFLERYKGFDPARLKFANAGKLETNERPKIEFYIVPESETEGKLRLVSYAKVNQTPCLDCCEDERVFPQYIGGKAKRRVTKQRTKPRATTTRRTTG